MIDGIDVKQCESKSNGASDASQSKGTFNGNRTGMGTSDWQPFEECDCEELIEEVSIDGMCGVY